MLMVNFRLMVNRSNISQNTSSNTILPKRRLWLHFDYKQTIFLKAKYQPGVHASPAIVQYWDTVSAMECYTIIAAVTPDMEKFPWLPHSCYVGEICKPITGSCILYTEIRECCCDRAIVKQWYNVFSSSPSMRSAVQLSLSLFLYVLAFILLWL